MLKETKRLKEIEMHLSYVQHIVAKLNEEVSDRLSEAEQIKAKKVLGLPLTKDEKSFMRALRRLEKWIYLKLIRT